VQPGDLVFFEPVSKGPSHVGIALGGGEFVHAPSSRGVVRYTSSYWAERWVGARRVELLQRFVMSGFSRTFTYFFNPLNSTMSLVVVVRATARRFPSRDHAKDATWRSLKCVICRGGPPSSGCDQMFDPLMST